MKRFALAVGLLLLLVPGLASAGFGDGVRAFKQGDYETAFREWRPLAERGEAISQFNIAILYSQGRGVARNYIRSYVWFTLAALGGHDKALQYRAGLIPLMSRTNIIEAKRLLAERLQR